MFDTEKFICEVEQRPSIWDVSSNSYSNKNEKSKAWEELCLLFIDGLKDMEKDDKNKEGM